MDRIRSALELAEDTKDLVIEPAAVSRAAEIFDRHFPGCRPLVIADENTFRTAGARVDTVVRAAHPECPAPHIFSGSPMLHPDYRHIQAIAGLLRQHDAVGIAVGSGTINDIVKLASHECGRGYMVAATAASMDGYASFGAAILKDDFKQTVPCAAPRAVLADVDVLTRAPYDMTASGYGDLLGKITAGADWLIADVLGVERIRADVWSLVQPNLLDWTAAPLALKSREAAAFSSLFEGLTVSALAMQAYGGTRPASGTEHLFSHVWEMQGLEVKGIPVSHGFKVGMGTLAATAFMEELFRRDLTSDDGKRAKKAWGPARSREEAVRSAFRNAPYVDVVVEVSLAKHLDSRSHSDRVDAIREKWPSIREAVGHQLLPFPHVRGLLEHAGCPVEPGQMGLDNERLAGTFALAQMIRPRYTALDLAYELGRMEDVVNSVFASGMYF